MFKVTAQRDDLSSDILYSDESLPGAKAKGVVLFDADKTLVFNGVNPPPNWVNPPEVDDGLNYFRYFQAVDEYRKPVNYQKYRDKLTKAEKAALKSEFPNGCDMHVFKLKRSDATFFVAKFVKKDDPIDFSQPIYLTISDIIICEPLSLLLTCYILIFNGFYVEWGTQRLCLRFDDDPTVAGTIHPGIVRLRLAFDALFRDDRLFFRTSFVASYSAAMLINADAQRISAQGNDKAYPNKHPLCESLVNHLKSYEESRGLPQPSKIVLVDDDKDYQPAFKGKQNYQFVHATPTAADACQPLRAILMACNLNVATVDPVLAKLRHNMKTLTELDIQHFRHYVLRDLSISETRKSLRADLFFRQIFLGGDVYAIALNETKVWFGLRDAFIHSRDLCKGPSQDIKNAEVKLFAMSAFPDENHFFVGGRLRKDSTGQSGRLLLLNNGGNAMSWLDIPHGVIIGLENLVINGQFTALCLGINHKSKSLTLYVINVTTQQIEGYAKYTVANCSDQDSINRYKYTIACVTIPGAQMGACYKAAMVATENDVPCAISQIDHTGSFFSEPFKPQFLDTQGKGACLEFSKATHAFCRFENHEKLWAVYGYAEKIDVWQVVHNIENSRATFIKSLNIPEGYSLSCMDISQDSDLLGFVFYNDKTKVTLVQLIKLTNLNLNIVSQETELEQNPHAVTACRFIKLNDVWHLLCPTTNLLQIVNYRH